jgi:hypothetical protein
MTTPSDRVTLLLHLQSASIRLQELLVCAEEMERMLEEEKGRLKERVDAVARTIEDEENRSLYYEEASDELEQLSTVFPNLFRSAFFAKCASEFENLLLSSARAHQKRAGILVGLGDLRGDGIQKAKLYFTKVAALRFPSDTQMWSDISHFAEIRNYVVHSDSKAPPVEAGNIQAFTNSRAPEILCDAKGAIRFTPSASSKAIEVYKAFIKEFIMRTR